MNTYKEELSTGIQLCINKYSDGWNWELKIHFCGPDRRYNGTTKNIYSSSIDKEAIYLRQDFQEYERLKSALTNGGSSSVNGVGGHIINVGGANDGVTYVDDYYHYYRYSVFPINTQERLEKVLNDFEYAKKRVPIVIANLANVNANEVHTLLDEKICEIKDAKWKEMYIQLSAQYNQLREENTLLKAQIEKGLPIWNKILLFVGCVAILICIISAISH